MNKIRKDIDRSLELIDRNKRVISGEEYDNLVEEKLNENKDYICYENNDSLIYYFGDHIETLKNKVLLKSRKK